MVRENGNSTEVAETTGDVGKSGVRQFQNGTEMGESGALRSDPISKIRLFLRTT
jgi:hypothetical protein